MPNETFLRVASDNTIHNHISAFKLLVTTDDFIFAIFFISSEHREELKNIHDILR